MICRTLSESSATAREIEDRGQADATAKAERLRAIRLAKERSDQIAAEVRKARRER